jgi:hypothetical protein
VIAGYVVRHFGPKGCGHPAFWVGRSVDETLLVYGVFGLDGARPDAGGVVCCGICGERVTVTQQLPLWVEPAVVVEAGAIA